MRNLMCLVVAGTLVTLAACSKNDGTAPTGPSAGDGKPKDMIVGVWEVVTTDPKEKGTREYKADGAVIITGELEGEKTTTTGKYKFDGDDLVVVELIPPVENAPKVTQKLKLTKITKDELVTKDDNGKEAKLKKVK